ncbi:Uncharacterised protein [uncultured archaeon]|nr:Uncharacterised protein [uncultured archaeon]
MKKRKGMTRRFNLSNRWMYFLITLGILAITAVGVYAASYTASGAGHPYTEISTCGAGQILQMNTGGTAWTCANASGNSLSSAQLYYSTNQLNMGNSTPGYRGYVGNYQVNIWGNLGVNHRAQFGSVNVTEDLTTKGKILGGSGRTAIYTKEDGITLTTQQPDCSKIIKYFDCNGNPNLDSPQQYCSYNVVESTPITTCPSGYYSYLTSYRCGSGDAITIACMQAPTGQCSNPFGTSPYITYDFDCHFVGYLV